MPLTDKNGYNVVAFGQSAEVRGGDVDAQIAAAIQEYEEKVAEAVREAYVTLHRLGLDDAQIVALLGLPAAMSRPARTQVSRAA